MIVTGGLAWWNDFIVLACYNISDRQEEVCFCSLRNNKFLYFKNIKHYLRTLQMAQTENNLPAKDPLEKKLTTLSNILPGNRMDRGRLQSVGSQRVRHN